MIYFYQYNLLHTISFPILNVKPLCPTVKVHTINRMNNVTCVAFDANSPTIHETVNTCYLQSINTFSIATFDFFVDIDRFSCEKWLSYV